jgi:ATP-binding cassette subfamily B protein
MTTPLETAVRCFAAVARRHGVDVSPERLVHEHALRPDEQAAPKLLEIARASGFEAKLQRLAWGDLQALDEGFPTIAFLANGNAVIITGVRGDKVSVLDPLSTRPGMLELEEATFAPKWTGEVLFLRRKPPKWASGEKNRFGLSWFAPEVWRQKGILRDVALAAVALHVLGLSLPIFTQIVLDKVLLHEAYTTLAVLTAGIAAALLFEAAFGFLRRYLLLYAASRVDIRVATQTFEKLLSLPIDFFERAPAGVLVKHMQQAEKVREFLTGRLFLTLLDATALLVILPVLFLYSATLTAVVLVCAGIIATVIVILIGPYRARLRALYQAEGERQAYLVETIRGMETVKSLALEPRRRRDWDGRSAEAVSSQFRLGRLSAAAQSVTGIAEKGMTVAIVGLGVLQVFDGAMTVGALIAFQMLSARVTGPLAQLAGLVHEYQEAALAVRMLGNVMDAESEPNSKSGLRAPVAGRIELEDVSFRYADGLPPALDRVSVDVAPGKVLGVVGRSGSGKTTLTRLLRGMYRPQSGAIRIDGLDVREFDLAHLRSSIGVVLQESFLFRGSVRENIALTRTEARLEDIVTAARLAGADEFIQLLPQGYETMLEESGSNLSGGQRQRLAIARALLRDPRILILDEATSALDPESEAIVQRNLARIAAGRTVVIVSHRLSSLVASDKILVLERGKVVGAGTHAELLETCQPYHMLWGQQHRHLQAVR